MFAQIRGHVGKLFALFVASCLLPGSVAFAEVQELSGRGEYIMEDSETVKEGQDMAYQEAMRSITQQAVVHIRADSTAVDAQLSQDDVELMANALIKVKDKRFQKTVLPDGKLQIEAFVVAELDEAASERALQERIAARKAQAELDNVGSEYDKQQSRHEELQKQYNEARRGSATQLVLDGDSLMEQKKTAEAMDCYNQAIEADPGMSAAYERRAYAYILLKKNDLAEQDYRRAISLDEKNANAHYSLARFLLEAKNPKEAVKEYRIFLDCANIVEHDKLISKALERIAVLGG